VAGDEIEIKKINPHSSSRFIVSEMMILANGLSADFASANSLPVIFRTQEPREALAVEQTPLVEALAFEKLRKTFKRSRLSLTPGLHSGLGLSAYTQASSPIRRYADLVTQRQFTAMLRELQSLTAGKSCFRSSRQRNGQTGNSSDRRPLDELLAAGVFVAQQEGAAAACRSVGCGQYRTGRLLPSHQSHAASKLQPGETVNVQIENIDSAKGEYDFAWFNRCQKNPLENFGIESIVTTSCSTNSAA
jgi:hypothetical protein